ncbi:MAG TPA: PRC-barrel domain-containing protein [Candidatus Polarisedimenticolia bacterium]|nr:PRC-barrel domain-containing protein [Candidatus Polarisedimenticolia bacterium]
MTTTLLKISTLCAACAMLTAVAQAQPDSQEGVINQNAPKMPPPASSTGQNTRSWSTKHLSATGRDGSLACRASKLNGAVIKDSSGNPAGVIQDVILDPVAGRVDFALVSLGGTDATASSNEKVVPVPWTLLKTSSGSSEYSTSDPEHCTFTLNTDANKLKSAPTVDWTNPSQSEWRQRIYSYYGVTPPPMGGAESPSGQMKGQGARQLQPIPPPAPRP